MSEASVGAPAQAAPLLCSGAAHFGAEVYCPGHIFGFSGLFEAAVERLAAQRHSAAAVAPLSQRRSDFSFASQSRSNFVGTEFFFSHSDSIAKSASLASAEGTLHSSGVPVRLAVERHGKSAHFLVLYKCPETGVTRCVFSQLLKGTEKCPKAQNLATWDCWGQATKTPMLEFGGERRGKLNREDAVIECAQSVELRRVALQASQEGKKKRRRKGTGTL